MVIDHYYTYIVKDFLAAEAARRARTAGGMAAPPWWQQMVWWRQYFTEMQGLAMQITMQLGCLHGSWLDRRTMGIPA